MKPFELFGAMALALAVSGCATSLTVERVSPTDPQSDWVADVISAHRQPSGAVVVCVVGTPAHTPWPFKSGEAPFSLTLPPGANVSVFTKSIRRHIPRYPVKQADVGGPCPEKLEGATPLAVHRIAREPYSLDDDSLSPLLSKEAGILVVETTYRSIFYVDESPRFEGRRAVWIRTDDRDVAGKPAYLLLLPFAIAWDVLMIPLYLIMALGGGLHGG
jgi:hypothetical protein